MHFGCITTLFNLAIICLQKMIQIAQQNGLISRLADHLIDGGCAILSSMLMTLSCSSRMAWKVPKT
jgi:hypothetical protein